MKLIKTDGKFKICFSAKELTLLVIAKFFSDLAKKIKKGSIDTLDISSYIKQLADQTADSTDYEFFTSVLDLHEQFEKNCEFCFNLKITFDRLYAFLKKKIILHYSGKLNFLIILQLKPYSNIDLNIFKKLYKSLKK